MKSESLIINNLMLITQKQYEILKSYNLNIQFLKSSLSIYIVLKLLS